MTVHGIQIHCRTGSQIVHDINRTHAFTVVQGHKSYITLAMQRTRAFGFGGVRVWSNEGTFSGDTLRFDSFISHLIEYIEVVKSLKGFFPMALPSKVMAVLLSFRAIPMYLPKKLK